MVLESPTCSYLLQPVKPLEAKMPEMTVLCPNFQRGKVMRVARKASFLKVGIICWDTSHVSPAPDRKLTQSSCCHFGRSKPQNGPEKVLSYFLDSQSYETPAEATL